jgi:hypothetical protein
MRSMNHIRRWAGDIRVRRRSGPMNAASSGLATVTCWRSPFVNAPVCRANGEVRAVDADLHAAVEDFQQ